MRDRYAVIKIDIKALEQSFARAKKLLSSNDHLLDALLYSLGPNPQYSNEFEDLPTVDEHGDVSEEYVKSLNNKEPLNSIEFDPFDFGSLADDSDELSEDDFTISKEIAEELEKLISDDSDEWNIDDEPAAKKESERQLEMRAKQINCLHKEKYINEAGGVKFWVCPSCKKDLGDAR